MMYWMISALVDSFVEKSWRNIGEQSFPSGDQKVWFVFRCEGKILLTLFGDHIFPCGDWRKKLISDPVNYEVYESKEQK